METLIRSRRSVLAVVYDDAAYGFEVHRYGGAGADPRTIEFPDTDFAGVAAAFGAEVATVRTVGDWRSCGRTRIGKRGDGRARDRQP
ncbi:thiamine pyrophosphate-dependent enzyme [Amycolatopsis sp. NPDC051061]|uniref:thiamine pyrophosphate-dependent enzyme n=1 Tax=Amycolatopsis sp. NPDC051061 TaxID=3155042 RepID=UPI0034178F83